MNPPRASARLNRILDAVSHASAKMRADKDMLRLADAHESLNPLAIDKLDFEAARRNPTIADAVRVLLTAEGRSTDPQVLVPGVRTEDITIEGAEGPLSARVYTPAGAAPFPVVVYFHGGGWVLADKDVYDGGARGICKQSGAIVISVDYRLRPRIQIPGRVGRRTGRVRVGARERRLARRRSRAHRARRRERRRQPRPGYRHRRA